VANPDETPAVEDPIDDKPMPLIEHLIELRKRMMWSLLAFAACFMVSYYFSGTIYTFLAQPLVDVMRELGNADPKLIYTQLYEAFFTRIKVAMFGGMFLGFPVIASQIWLFVAPGLYRSEKRALLPFLAATPILFVAGGALAYYFIFPKAFLFFASFQDVGGASGVAIELMPKVGEYLDLVMKLILATGLIFQMPVATSLLAKVGIITAQGMRRQRKYAILGMTVVAAMVAPPDLLSMLLFAVPLVLLYELSILAALLVQPKPPED
jgi:sec-independent protein translocase protein TatC